MIVVSQLLVGSGFLILVINIVVMGSDKSKKGAPYQRSHNRNYLTPNTVIPRLDRGIQKDTGCPLKAAGMTAGEEWTSEIGQFNYETLNNFLVPFFPFLLTFLDRQQMES